MGPEASRKLLTLMKKKIRSSGMVSTGVEAVVRHLSTLPTLVNPVKDWSQSVFAEGRSRDRLSTEMK
jgi:hypothetical protein